MITWTYADKYGELPSGQAEIAEALVEIARQLDSLNETMKHLDNYSVEGLTYLARVSLEGSSNA